MTFQFTYNYPQVARDSGFKLRNYKDGPLDWRLIGSMEVERILRDQSFEQIDAALNHLSEAPLGSILESNILDSGIAKYFILSQFSVQYLIFCRKFLEETVTDLRESHSISQMELATLKRSLSEANNEILQLHKKITQMEAIHEVIYPCHLCTKNFVSNDALNLHISRKHDGSLSKTEKKSEASQPISKDQKNDLTLIHTIKLELEIKQLKERLNNAEREIKEKSVASDVKKVQENAPAELEKSEIISVHSIGIQSNLSEIKEKDDSSEGNLSTPSPNRHQQYILQEKLLELEKWREEQDRQNSEFLIEVNNKMKDICTALEMTRNQRDVPVNDEIQMSTSTVEELKMLMTKKVEEMGKTTTANLEYIVNKMETNYKNKLNHLEKELNMLCKQCLLQKDSKSDENPTQFENPPQKNSDVKNNINGNFKFFDVKSNAPDGKTKVINGPEKQQGDTHLPKDISISESNITFVKYTNDSQPEKESSSDMSGDDCTDLSASLLDEDNLEKPYETKIINIKKKHVSRKKRNLHKQPSAKSNIMSKKDAIKLTNHRLSLLGINVKAKRLTPFSKKRLLDDLNEKRNKLKLKYPQFHATRVEIKKFVDKLCSTQMPSSAQALLKATKSIKPTVRQNVNRDEYSSSGEEDAEFLKASTPLNEKYTTDTEIFKQRLQRILTSPIRKPDDHILKTAVHQEYKNQKPVPMLRKRVMFNQPEV